MDARQLCEVAAKNDKTQVLDLSSSGLSDSALQRLVAALATGALPALRTLDLRSNEALGAAADTVLHGLRRLRPELTILRAEGDNPGLAEASDTFACDRELIEGLTAWPMHEVLVREGSNDMRCPVCSEHELKPGLITSGGNQHRCLDGCGSHFLQSIGTSSLSLIGLRRKPPG